MSDEPLIRVVRGSPTEHEVAALVSVLLSRPAPARRPAPAPSRWARSARPGPGGWDRWRAGWVGGPTR